MQTHEGNADNSKKVYKYAKYRDLTKIWQLKGNVDIINRKCITLYTTQTLKGNVDICRQLAVRRKRRNMKELRILGKIQT